MCDIRCMPLRYWYILLHLIKRGLDGWRNSRLDIYWHIVCGVWLWEERKKLLWKISLLKTQLLFWNYCNWLIPIIISLRQIVSTIVLCNLILRTWCLFITKLIFHKTSYPLCTDAQVVNMWHSWKRLAYLYISNGHISNIHPNPHFPSKNCEQRKNYIFSMRVSHTSNKSVVFYPSSMFRKRWNLNSGTFC